MSIDRSQFDQKFAELRKRFSGRLLEYADQLETLMAGCPDAHSDIADLIHRVAGTAGSFGFSEVSRAAGVLDEDFVTGTDPCGRQEALGALVTLLRAQAA